MVQASVLGLRRSHVRRVYNHQRWRALRSYSQVLGVVVESLHCCYYDVFSCFHWLLYSFHLKVMCIDLNMLSIRRHD